MKYESARAFRQALEERIRRDYDSNQIPRIRKMIAFERLMARLGQHWVLKGGYAIQLRTDMARTTQDVDLFVADISEEDIGNILRQELNQDLGDYFAFTISQSDVLRAGGRNLRFQVDARVAGRVFERFHIDVGFTDPLFEPIDKIIPPNFLDFAQVEVSEIPCYSIYQHIAEKVHAIARPRTRESSRVKDLVDLIILASLDTRIEADSLKEAITLIFESHADSVPGSFDNFPSSWEVRYQRLSRELDLQFTDFPNAYQATSQFISPVVSGNAKGLIWDSKNWEWN